MATLFRNVNRDNESIMERVINERARDSLLQAARTYLLHGFLEICRVGRGVTYKVLTVIQPQIAFFTARDTDDGAHE